LEDDFDRAWFDFVIEGLSDYPVLFPQDIGNRKGDRLSGRIVEVGMGFQHKYRGIAVEKIEASWACNILRVNFFPFFFP
jgi:hypothetical protein